MATITNREVGRRVGCDHTSVSRLRSGGRMPSTGLLARICREFELDEGEALRILAQDQDRGDGRATLFSAWLREHVFGEAALPRRLDIRAPNMVDLVS